MRRCWLWRCWRHALAPDSCPRGRGRVSRQRRDQQPRRPPHARPAPWLLLLCMGACLRACEGVHCEEWTDLSLPGVRTLNSPAHLWAHTHNALLLAVKSALLLLLVRMLALHGACVLTW